MSGAHAALVGMHREEVLARFARYDAQLPYTEVDCVRWFIFLLGDAVVPPQAPSLHHFLSLCLSRPTPLIYSPEAGSLACSCHLHPPTHFSALKLLLSYPLSPSVRPSVRPTLSPSVSPSA